MDGDRETSNAQLPLDEQGAESEERREGSVGQAGLQPCSNVWAVHVQADVPSSTAVLHCKIWIILLNTGEDAKDKQKSLQSDVQTMVMYFIIK